MIRNAVLFASLSLAIFACRGGDDGGGDYTTVGDDAPNPDGPPVNVGVVDISEVQSETMVPGTKFTLKNVVVTAVDNYGTFTGDLFVQDEAGGPFSGIKVFRAPLDQVSLLMPGDRVDITNGEKAEYQIAMSELSLTEVVAAEGSDLIITRVAGGTPPTPVEVDAAAIAVMTKEQRVAEWEKWEGVLIKVVKARQIAVATINATNEDRNEIRLTGVVRIQAAMVELPNSTVGDCFTSVTGVGDSAFNHYVVPRTAADVVGGGTGCRPLVESVVAVQTATEAPEIARLTGVYVTGIDNIGDTTKGFWVQDALQGAASNGVYVFTRNLIPTGIEVGKKVNIIGGVTEFDLGSGGNPATGDTITQIADAAFSMIEAGGTPLPATGVSVETLGAIGAAGEVWEGVLVQIGPVKVTNAMVGMGANARVEVTDNNTHKVQLAKEAFAFTAPAVGTCIQVVGLMSVAIYDDLRTINPRSAADITTVTGCN